MTFEQLKAEFPRYVTEDDRDDNLLMLTYKIGVRIEDDLYAAQERIHNIRIELLHRS